MRRTRESGFALLLVFAMAAAMAIALYLQLPRVAFESQRNKEQLLIERGEQYQRAIQLYVRKFKKYPVKLEDLENTNNIRFLRRRYSDPMTGKNEWRLIHVGPGGVLTDSKVQKPPQGNDKDKEKKEASENTFISEAQPIGSLAPTPQEGQLPGSALVRRMRPSEMHMSPDGSTLPPVTEGQPPAATSNNMVAPGMALYGQPIGVVGQVPQGNPGGPINAYGQPNPSGQPISGAPVNPYGQPNPSGQPNPFTQPNPAGQANPSIPGLPVQAGIVGTYAAPAQTEIGSPAPSSIQASVQGAQSPFSAPGMNPYSGPMQPAAGGQNEAARMIMEQLTRPRQVPLGAAASPSPGGLQIGGGIAGVASTFEGDSIKVYNDHDKYEEWEFIYDMKNDKSLMAAIGVPGQIPGTTPVSQMGQGPQTPATGMPPGPFSPAMFGPQPPAVFRQPGAFGQPGMVGRPGMMPPGIAGQPMQPVPAGAQANPQPPWFVPQPQVGPGRQR